MSATDHAVLVYLQRQGIDVEAVRRHISGLARNGAELGAAAVKIEQVRLELRERGITTGNRPRILVVAVRDRNSHGRG